MYCKVCGKQIEDDSIFCRYCGVKQEIENLNQDSIISEATDILKKNHNYPEYRNGIEYNSFIETQCNKIFEILRATIKYFYSEEEVSDTVCLNTVFFFTFFCIKKKLPGIIYDDITIHMCKKLDELSNFSFGYTQIVIFYEYEMNIYDKIFKETHIKSMINKQNPLYYCVKHYLETCSIEITTESLLSFISFSSNAIKAAIDPI